MPRALFHGPSWFPVLAGAVLALLPSCLGDAGSRSAGLGGSVTQAPGRDGHGVGGVGDLYLVSAVFGRLVTVLDQDGLLVDTDVLIRGSVRSDGVHYELSRNPATADETLRILHSAGTTPFNQWLAAAQSGLSSLAVKGLGSPPPFTMVPRNAAIRLEFSDQVDPATVDETTVQVMIGEPPQLQQAIRYVVKNDRPSKRGFVILDPTITSRQSGSLGLPANLLGFPESTTATDPNLLIRIPTAVEPAYGQFEVLRDLGRTRTITPQPGDPLETSPGGAPIVVRAARSGNSADPLLGFLEDHSQPSLVGVFDCSISFVSSPQPWSREITWSLDALNCRQVAPRVGDVLESGSAILLLTNIINGSNPAAYQARFALIDGAFISNYSGTGMVGTVSTRYDSRDEPLQTCYLRFTPEPATALPARGLDPYASILLKFDEPMDPRSISSLETCVPLSFVYDPDPASTDPARQFDPAQESVAEFIDRLPGYGPFEPGNPARSGSGRLKFGAADLDPESRLLTVAPSAGLSDAHAEGNGILLAFALRDGADGLRDLAGNPLDLADFVAGNSGQQELLELDPAVPWPTDRYFALRFNSTDENGDGLLEYSGQYSFQPGVLRGRDFARFSRAADLSNPYVAQRIQFSAGIMDPLTPAGAVMMGVYPYHLLGLGLSNVAEMNLDVEGLAWTPFGGAVFQDAFPRYSLALAHSSRFPDDSINPMSGYPNWPNSGLRRNADFDQNILGFPALDEQVVSDGSYIISPADLFIAPSGAPMLPWPEFTETYTWRDTGIPTSFTGGANGAGVPPDTVVLGNKVYPAGAVPSIGLPLLVRYRCYPRGNFFGANGFQAQIMVGSSALPAFRVYSAGGRDAGGGWHQVIPDDPGSGGTFPLGGYNPSTGSTTRPQGPEIYWSQVDFVLRVSRVVTHWFTFGDSLDSLTPVFVEPGPAFQPPGSSVVVEFRGSNLVTQTNCGGVGPLTDALVLDEYGELPAGSCGNVSTPGEWTEDLNNLLGVARFFQMRLTFLANRESGKTSELHALGFTWGIP